MATHLDMLFINPGDPPVEFAYEHYNTWFLKPELKENTIHFLPAQSISKWPEANVSPGFATFKQRSGYTDQIAQYAYDGQQVLIPIKITMPRIHTSDGYTKNFRLSFFLETHCDIVYRKEFLMNSETQAWHGHLGSVLTPVSYGSEAGFTEGQKFQQLHNMAGLKVS